MVYACITPSRPGGDIVVFFVSECYYHTWETWPLWNKLRNYYLSISIFFFFLSVILSLFFLFWNLLWLGLPIHYWHCIFVWILLNKTQEWRSTMPCILKLWLLLNFAKSLLLNAVLAWNRLWAFIGTAS